MPKRREQLLQVFAPIKGEEFRLPPPFKHEQYAELVQNLRVFRGTVVPSPLATTFGGNLPLLGEVHRIDRYIRDNGTEHLMAFTTKYIYEYNTTDSAWEVISRSAVVENGEDAWTANANVTVSTDTVNKKRGNASAKMTIAAAFTTGVAAYEDITSVDLTSYTYLHYWIRSDIATVAGDLQILLDDTSGCVSPLESLDVPALVAATWKEVEVAIATPAGLGAVISVGLKVVVDNGAQVVLLDDIRAMDRHSGTQDTHWETTFFDGDFFAVNGNQESIQRKDDASDWEDMAGGTTYKAETVRDFKGHLNIYHTYESGTEKPKQIRWSKLAGLAYAAADWTDTGSGFAVLREAQGSEIINAFPLNDNMVIYLDESIVHQTHVAGTSVYNFHVIVQGVGLAAKKAVMVIGDKHYFLGSDNMVYEYRGTAQLIPVGAPIFHRLSELVNPKTIGRAFFAWDRDFNLIQLHIPTSGANPDKVFVYDYVNQVWTEEVRAYYGVGETTETADKTWGDFTDSETWGAEVGFWGQWPIRESFPFLVFGDTAGYVFKENFSALDTHNGTAATAQDMIFESIDHSAVSRRDNLVGEVIEYVHDNKRWLGVAFEARGIGDIEVSYSTSQGTAWVVVGDTTLTNLWRKYEVDFDTTSPLLRIRFRSNTSAKGFELRYYAIKFLKKSHLVR